MKQFRLTFSARADLEEICQYAAERNVVAADRLIDRLYDAFVVLANNPGIGNDREEYAKGLRAFPCGRYVVYFRRTEDSVGQIDIVRVIHGSRDARMVFSGEND